LKHQKSIRRLIETPTNKDILKISNKHSIAHQTYQPKQQLSPNQTTNELDSNTKRNENIERGKEKRLSVPMET